ncbi:hypothetical protein EUX98_g3198 [Antrodiella citrinella]|uniref:GH18 domain-containing protein n=1 Tax=Antrodiella citrinella TaxID=2447956 RepID=A0A4S4MYF8_9APHY|nr:hypothetical protein EUX98_g3198 [Antrodiella citrinella]
MLHIGPLSLLFILPLTALAVPTCSLGSFITPTASDSATSSNQFVASTWYTSWHESTLPLEDLSWDKYTSVAYAFATTTEDPKVVASIDDGLLTNFVTSAHHNSVTAILSVGGWTGSEYFSWHVAEENRTTFVQTMVNLVNQYSLDGLEFDWEYPGKQGIGCNIVNQSDDTDNFLLFLKQLRNTTEMTNRIISAAVRVVPFTGSDGNPMSDVSAFTEPLDYVSIMDYDIWGNTSPSVGPNAPLNDTCYENSPVPGSSVSALSSWTTAGFPPDKLVLGVASYGHSYTVSTVLALNTSAPAATNGTLPILAYPFNLNHSAPQGDSLDPYVAAGMDSCGTQTAGGYSGVFNFFGLIDKGFLDASGDPMPGMGYRYDECSQTPYVYNVDTQEMISYDDPQSFAAKGQFIKNNGLRGFAMWEAAGDRNNILLDSISQAAGCQ